MEELEKYAEQEGKAGAHREQELMQEIQELKYQIKSRKLSY